MTERELQDAAESLSRAAEEHLNLRYYNADLEDLSLRQIQHNDHALANALWHWRTLAGWEEPATIGEERCVVCHKLMRDESSVCEDETVCVKCASDDDSPTTDENR